MIGILEQPEGGLPAESLNESTEWQLSVGELVASSLQEQHGQLDR